MRYAVIATNGDLHLRDEPGYWLDIFNQAVGREGFDRVSLPYGSTFGAYVNDCGHLFPEQYPRNVIGSLILVGLGALALPYAGPVVVTGWDDSEPDAIEVRDLTGEQQSALADVHLELRQCLGQAGGEPSAAMAEWWAIDGARYAEHVRTAPTPAITMLHDEDAAAYLRSLRGAR